jgi:UDP-N-acetylglucosamine 3-dehydrogenase
VKNFSEDIKRPVRTAVIGCGAMGLNHARVLADLPGSDLVGIVDVDPQRAAEVARRHRTEAFTSLGEMLDSARPEAVVVAVPTALHLDTALQAIARCVHVLIEKPIAFSVEDGEKLVSAAADAGVVLAVGHVERFNPAVRQLKQRLSDGELGKVFQIEARRQGPFPARVGDVGVIIDLAVHDLDVIRHVTGSEVTRLSAETQRRIHSEHEDLLVGLLRLKNGAVGQLTINWLTPTKIRKLVVSGERGMFEMNYLTQDLIFFENALAPTQTEWATMHVLRGVSEGSMTRHIVNKREPLRIELEAFVAACQDPSKRCGIVSGEDGIEALRLAKAFVHAGSSGETMNFAR